MNMDLDFLGGLGAGLRGRSTGGLAADTPASTSSTFDVGARSAVAAAKGEKPLFHSQELNRAIVTKVIAPRSAEIVLRPNQLATKILIPYESEAISEKSRARIGIVPGRYVFYGQRFFRDSLENYFFGGLSDEQKAQDLKILEALHHVPSLDAFLIKDKLDLVDPNISGSYTNLTPEEWQRIRNVIIEDFRPLASRAFANLADVTEKTSTLVDKIWFASDTESLSPLIAAMNIDPAQAKEIFQAWKGISFYRQKYLANIAAVFADIELLTTFEKLPRPVNSRRLDWTHVKDAINRKSQQTQKVFEIYDSVSKSLCKEDEDIAPFITFLKRGPDLFWLLGSNMAALDHTTIILRGMRKIKLRVSDFLDDAYDALEGVLVATEGGTDT